MITATGMVWDAAGRPDPGPVRREGVCGLCGMDGPLHGSLGGNFTDYRMLAVIGEDGLCAACTWVLSGRPPATLRMWTLVVRHDRPAAPSQLNAYVSGEFLHATNRRDMTWVAATLADPPADGVPWLVAVAESGHKHTAPFATVNYGPGRWTVRLDGTDITADAAIWRDVLGHSTALRAAGFPAVDVESGQPAMNRLKGDALTAWRLHASHLRTHAGTPLLHLANLVITKETCEHYLTTYPA
jgi:hypothetical protein